MKVLGLFSVSILSAALTLGGTFALSGYWTAHKPGEICALHGMPVMLTKSGISSSSVVFLQHMAGFETQVNNDLLQCMGN